MPAGRPNRPLFDLIAEENADKGRRAIAANPAVEFKPASRQPPRDPTDASEQIASARSRTSPRGFFGSLAANGRARIDITTPWFAASVALALAILLGVWIIAYKLGESEATVRLTGGAPAPPPRLTSDQRDATRGVTTVPDDPAASPSRNRSASDPLTASPPVGIQSGERTEPRPSSSRDRAPDGGRTAADAFLPGANRDDSGPFPVYNGSFTTDPRTPGMNYLLLASGMTRADAREAIDFLGRNGYFTVAVPVRPVDRGVRDGNNDPLYKLFHAEGFESTQMKATQSRRDRMADEARRLGAIYQRQHRGKYNFAKVNWEKYVR
ncbi:MAG: hypothetical protein KF787_03570 [Phycisphaeraceae bacterium]|nr:hypothetical protein [Phycisphaerae bacterium]MBX3391707.1 hypothetical protein [Phycisphaeraceae bacterium]HRJ49530.1 hypothetical protein [Phycisphaerales bacterium]